MELRLLHSQNPVRTGYLLNSKIYTGKEGNAVERDLGKKAVLCVMEPFLDKGYSVFMDNYYTSVALFEELEERKTLACGSEVQQIRPTERNLWDSRKESKTT